MSDPVGEQGPERREGRGRLRLAMRLAALTAATVLLVPLVPWSGAALAVPALSPLVAVSAAVAARGVSAATFIGLPVLVACLIRARWFCRRLCPVGLLTEQADRLALGKAAWAARVPRIGRAVAFVAFGGACFGYPLLLWLDPLAIFSGAFGVFHAPAAAAGAIAAAMLGGILALGIVLPGAWCGRLCALGATQEFLAKWRGWLRRRGKSGDAGEPRLARRAWLRGASGALLAVAGAGSASFLRRVARARPKPPLRPPGAVEEDRFAGACIRCGNCLRGCPTGILRPDLAPERPDGWLAPVVVFDSGYCREDCRRCTQVCPSGAIARLSLAAKRKAVIGLAKVELDLCRLSDNRECDLCRRHCPFDAVTFAWSEAAYCRSPVIDAARCTGCGACEVACPGPDDTRPPRRAIAIAPQRATL